MDISLQTYESASGVTAFDTQGLRLGEDRAIEHFKAGTILDLGCGTGRTSAILRDRGFAVTAIDYSAAMIARAREKYPDLSFEVMDAADLRYADGAFDNAFFSYNGLDYLYPESQRLKALREIHRILKPGGMFAFSSHRLRFPRSIGQWIRLVRTVLKGRIYPYQWDFQEFGDLLTHFTTTARQMKQLQEAGFSLVEQFNAKDCYYVSSATPAV